MIAMLSCSAGLECCRQPSSKVSYVNHTWQIFSRRDHRYSIICYHLLDHQRSERGQVCGQLYQEWWQQIRIPPKVSVILHQHSLTSQHTSYSLWADCNFSSSTFWIASLGWVWKILIVLVFFCCRAIQRNCQKFHRRIAAADWQRPCSVFYQKQRGDATIILSWCNTLLSKTFYQHLSCCTVHTTASQ